MTAPTKSRSGGQNSTPENIARDEAKPRSTNVRNIVGGIVLMAVTAAGTVYATRGGGEAAPQQPPAVTTTIVPGEASSGTVPIENPEATPSTDAGPSTAEGNAELLTFDWNPEWGKANPNWESLDIVVDGKVVETIPMATPNNPTPLTAATDEGLVWQFFGNFVTAFGEWDETWDPDGDGLYDSETAISPAIYWESMLAPGKSEDSRIIEDYFEDFAHSMRSIFSGYLLKRIDFDGASLNINEISKSPEGYKLITGSGDMVFVDGINRSHPIPGIFSLRLDSSESGISYIVPGGGTGYRFEQDGINFGEIINY